MVSPIEEDMLKRDKLIKQVNAYLNQVHELDKENMSAEMPAAGNLQGAKVTKLELKNTLPSNLFKKTMNIDP